MCGRPVRVVRRTSTVFGGGVDAEDPADHGIAVVMGDDWVDLVDTCSEGEPRVRFSRQEYETFVEGVRRGDFDRLPQPRTGDDL